MRIGLLANSILTEFRLNTLKPILEDSSFSVELAVIYDIPAKTLWEKLIKNLERERGGYVFIMALKKLFPGKEKRFSTKAFCEKNRIPVLKTPNVYSNETIEQLKKANLDVLVLAGDYGIVKKNLLNVSAIGVLSYHHGNMRKYRGMPPALWELYNNEKEMGLTLQILTPGLDCGKPVEERTISIHPADNLKQLTSRALKESEDMMYVALKKLSNPAFLPEEIEHFGKIYTLPNLTEWFVLNIKIFIKRVKYLLHEKK